jgi:hypothetical protein
MLMPTPPVATRTSAPPVCDRDFLERVEVVVAGARATAAGSVITTPSSTHIASVWGEPLPMKPDCWALSEPAWLTRSI